MTLEIAFGRILKELRLGRRLSQEQLGFESGYHRTYISMLERGLKSPSLSAIFQLAIVLDVSPSEMIRLVEVQVGDVTRRGLNDMVRSDEDRPR